MIDSPSDSLGMQTINGKNFVIYKVNGTESLYSLSKRYGTTPEEIIAYNPNSDSGLEPGQILRVPYNPKPKGNVPKMTSNGLVHIVSAQETLFGISRQYHVTVDDILKWNNMKTNTISIGQELIVQKPSEIKAETPKVLEDNAPKRIEDNNPKVLEGRSTNTKTHVVAPKETLYSISREYGLEVQQLRKLNNITGNDIKIGQVLVVEEVSLPDKPTVASSSTPQEKGNDLSIDNDWDNYRSKENLKVSDKVIGFDEIRETGLAGKIEGSEGNRKYLAYYSKLKPGTIIKIRSLSNNLEVFARVLKPDSKVDAGTFVKLSQSVFNKLGVKDNVFKAEIIYYQ